MGQPIRRTIQETHPDKITEPPFYTLLIDGNSLLFSCFADKKMTSEGLHYGGIFQFLLQMKIIMSKRQFDYVYVFFDSEFSGWLRWNLYKPYKANRDKKYQDYGLSDYMKAFNENVRGMQKYLFGNKNKRKEKDKIETRIEKQTKKSEWDEFIDENFDRERDILCRCFNELYVRWYIDDVVEGDDLISYYVKNKKKNEIIYIISSDMDISQLLDDNVAIYNQKIKKYLTKDNFKDYFGYYYGNTLVKKIFCGDVSDNIGNIKGLSETGFMNLMPEVTSKQITVEDVKKRAKELIDERIAQKKKPLKVHENILNGISNKEYDGDFYEINKKIINLKEPLLTNEAKEEMDSMMYAPQDPEGRSFKNLYKIILEAGVEDLFGDTIFGSFFSPFKLLEEKEIAKYNEYIKNN